MVKRKRTTDLQNTTHKTKDISMCLYIGLTLVCVKYCCCCSRCFIGDSVPKYTVSLAMYDFVTESCVYAYHMVVVRPVQFQNGSQIDNIDDVLYGFACHIYSSIMAHISCFQKLFIFLLLLLYTHDWTREHVVVYTAINRYFTFYKLFQHLIQSS
jgi:hypothetical protein